MIEEHLEGDEEADLETFTSKVWPNIKDFFKTAEQQEQAKKESEDNNAAEPEKGDSYDGPEDEYDDEEEEEEEDEDQTQAQAATADPGTPPLIIPGKDDPDTGNRLPGIPATKAEEEENDDDKMPDYDEETQALINVAEEARHNFNDAETKLKDTENQIKGLEAYLNIDYGPEEEYSALKGNCYEYTDREYIYKLCAFERASQRPKAGGSETTLGNWGRWEGPAEDKYAVQKYDNGLSCWNGPNRSVKVNFKCGLENQVTNAFEPSRCEYEFDFTTPAKCTAPKVVQGDVHDEL